MTVPATEPTYLATPEQIAELRGMINEPTTDPWTDLILGTIIDTAAGDLNSAARTVWVRKAASLSTLVDVKEGNSDRKLSQLHKNALLMVDQYSTMTVGATARRTRTRKIDRQ